MKTAGSLILILIITFGVNYAQTVHDVSLLGNNTFSPADLTVPVGDIVRWTNNGGLHNVVADDGSFTSGSVSSAIWVFTHTFDTEGEFRYFCAAHGAAGGIGMSGIVRVTGATDVDDDVQNPDFKLNQNYPNPFNPSTTIEYSIPRNEFVTLKVYNITGSLEDVIVSENLPAGNYIVQYNASGLSSGVYFYQLIAGNYISTKRMIVLK